jgi:hypothetical protein
MKKHFIILTVLIIVLLCAMLVACLPNGNELPKPVAVIVEIEFTGIQISLNIVGFLADKMTVTGNVGTNVGNYQCVISLNDGYVWDDGSVDDVVIAWKIVPKKITKPTANGVIAFAHSGELKTLALAGVNNAVMTVSGDISATAVGDYACIISLNDKTNYVWSDNTTNDVVINWSITTSARSQIQKPSGHLSTFHTGLSVDFSAHSRFDNIRDKVSFINFVHTEVGVYRGYISIADTTKYEWSDGTDSDIVASNTVLPCYTGVYVLKAVAIDGEIFEFEDDDAEFLDDLDNPALASLILVFYNMLKDVEIVLSRWGLANAKLEGVYIFPEHMSVMFQGRITRFDFDKEEYYVTTHLMLWNEFDNWSDAAHQAVGNFLVGEAFENEIFGDKIVFTFNFIEGIELIFMPVY